MTMRKTAMGKMVDIDAIIKQNEGVKAVGNVPMNARGDRINPNGSVKVSANTVSRVQKDIIQPTTTEKLSDALQPEKMVEKTKSKKQKPNPIGERTKYDLDGNEIIEIEYDDGSIEVKNAK